ncbi:MAG: hypothetical protein ACXW3G_06935, partial [Rhodoplanes sp.]
GVWPSASSIASFHRAARMPEFCGRVPTCANRGQQDYDAAANRREPSVISATLASGARRFAAASPGQISCSTYNVVEFDAR